MSCQYRRKICDILYRSITFSSRLQLSVKQIWSLVVYLAQNNTTYRTLSIKSNGIDLLLPFIHGDWILVWFGWDARGEWVSVCL